MAWDAGIFVGGCDHCDDLDGDSVLCDHDTCRTAIHSGRCIRGGGCGRMWNGTSIFPDHASLYQTDIDHNGAFADDLDL